MAVGLVSLGAAVVHLPGDEDHEEEAQDVAYEGDKELDGEHCRCLPLRQSGVRPTDDPDPPLVGVLVLVLRVPLQAPHSELIRVPQAI